LLSSGDRAYGVVIKGVDPAIESASDEALRRLTSGSADFAPDANGFDSILIGQNVGQQSWSRRRRLRDAHEPRRTLDAVRLVPRSRRFRVAGIYNSGFYDYDANWGFVTLGAAQGLAGVGDVASVLEFRLAIRIRAAQAAAELETPKPAPVTSRTPGRMRIARAIPRAAF